MESNAHFMNKSRLRNEDSLSNGPLELRLRQKSRKQFCLFSARSAVLAGCRSFGARCAKDFLTVIRRGLPRPAAC